ncbi:MAG: NAD(P)H-hydrate dehydratase [Chloroflexi bacterium]|nr:NAD(P)H-hydrate dehydratase [Chloroflexota bacterium]
MKVASVRETREIEEAVNRSIMSYDQMMRNAGAAASAHLQRRCQISAETKVAFLIGKGNNGGDGLVMARHLANATRADIKLYLLAPRDPTDEHYEAVAAERLSITHASDDRDGRALRALIAGADVIIDALFGIGLRLPLRGRAATALNIVKQSLSKIAPRPFVFALDCPSGVDCDTGEADPSVLSADETITFIAAKMGHFIFPAAAQVGKLTVSTIGIPHALPELERIQATFVDEVLAAALLPARPLDGHKGTFGKVMVVAGSPHYIGAIALAGEAAYRSGAGLVTIATTRRLIEIVGSRLREPTWLPLADAEGAIAEGASATVSEMAEGYDSLLVGCGLGTRAATQTFLRRLLASRSLPGLVIDADALNILSRQARWWETLPSGAIITPHAGELARLTGEPMSEISADRWNLAREYAQKWNAVLVLKGAHTLVAAPDGRVSVIPFKTDALSTAGTGDVLAGLIAGLRGQGLTAYDSARLGAYAHALAGTIAVESIGSSRSVVAGDVLSAMGRAFARLESI